MSKINLPNRLTILRVILVPVFMMIVLIPPDTLWTRIIAAAVFILIALTDTLDGFIARRRALITDFGKFLDPIADKFLIFGAMLAMLVKYGAGTAFGIVWMVAIVIIWLREFAVTSLRLVVVNNTGTVVAAGILGKIKTVLQVVTVIVVLLEPAVVNAQWGIPESLFSYIFTVLMTAVTVWSGADYCVKYMKDMKMA